MKKVKFGRRLEKERLAGGLSRKVLADLSGISEQNVFVLETGKTESPRISTVEKLAKALKCDPQYLAGWD